MPPKELVPVVPEWCDCTFRNRCPKRSTIFLGSCRIVIATLSFILCTLFAVNPAGAISDDASGVDLYNIPFIRGILITICIINVFHLGAAIFLIYMARSNMNNTPKIRRWLIVDLIITGAFVICVVMVLFSMPPHQLYLILGFKLMFLSLLFCYRAGATYLIFASNEKQVMVNVASPDGLTHESRYDNVYRV